jgi:AraC-like DNA-binding protein
VSANPTGAFSTAEVAPCEALGHWREMIGRAFVPLDVAPARGGGEFRAAASLRSIGELRVARIEATPMAVLRGARHIVRSSEDDYFLALHVKGLAHGAQDGRRVTLGAGDFALFDSTRPYALEFRSNGAFELLIFRIPRLALDARAATLGKATAIPVPADSEQGRLVSPYMTALAAIGAEDADRWGHRLSASALDLLSVAIGSRGQGRGAPPLPSQAVLARVRQQTLARLDDAGLRPSDVAAASFVSVRQLHRLFAAEDITFGGFLREARLTRCREDLADPRLAGRPIAEIAARWGCRSAAHFTRTFTARYGMTPRDFRASARASEPESR